MKICVNVPDLEFKNIPEGEELPAPWRPTHMKSYSKDKIALRIWARKKESDDANADNDLGV